MVPLGEGERGLDGTIGGDLMVPLGEGERGLDGTIGGGGGGGELNGIIGARRYHWGGRREGIGRYHWGGGGGISVLSAKHKTGNNHHTCASDSVLFCCAGLSSK